MSLVCVLIQNSLVKKLRANKRDPTWCTCVRRVPMKGKIKKYSELNCYDLYKFGFS